MTKKEKNRVNRQWRKSLHKIFTGPTQSFNDLLAELCSIGGSYQQQRLPSVLMKQIQDDTADAWNACRLGYAGTRSLTTQGINKAQVRILSTAFAWGTKKRAEDKEKYAQPPPS